MLTTLPILLALASSPSSQPADDGARSWINNPDAFYQLSLHAELGFLASLSHTIQFGRDGTSFDYVQSGGQDVLFPFLRLSADLTLWKRHTVVFLYQPLDIKTRVLLDQDILVDGQSFAKNTPMDLGYGFSFWRLSYLFDFFDDPATELAVGASLQIRNANIDFASVDGTAYRAKRNIGPVPILKARARTDLGSSVWTAGEVDGFWAPIRYLNGGDSDVEGAIVDLSLKAGVHLMHGIDPFLGVRYIAGGAQGTNSSNKGPGDGFSDNWLHFVSVTLGTSLR
ncbi:MAG: hypothetical protein ABIJ09_06160 [Pseudomonadota bacterium]